MNKPLFLNKGKHIYCCRHFLEHGESAKGGWGDSGVCCFKECTMPQIILWNLLFCTNVNFGICVLEQKQSHLPTPAPLLFVICLFFPLAFTAIKSEMFTSSPNFHFAGWWFCTSWTASGWLHSGWGRERTPRGSTATTLRTSGEPPSLEPIQNLVRAILNSIPILALIGFRLPNKKGICKKLAQEYGLTKQTNDTGTKWWRLSKSKHVSEGGSGQFLVIIDKWEQPLRI